MSTKNTNCPDWLIFAYKSRLISESRLDQIWLELTKIWSQNNRTLKLARWGLNISENQFHSSRKFRLIYPPSFDLTLLH